MRLIFIIFFSSIFLFCGCQSAEPQTFDVLIVNGNVFTGEGDSPQILSIGILADTIAWIGTSKDIRADSYIDASGLIVAPGFIDPHTHTLEDMADSAGRINVPFLMQGVTTVVAGNDGGGPMRIANTLSYLEKNGMGTNMALYVGHGTIRNRVLGAADRNPTEEELAQMQELVRQAMEEGALGLSTGLYYAPGSFAKTEEVIELAKIVSEYGGIYDSHIRDESSYSIGLLGSVEEVIQIARGAKIPAHIAHIKALGADVWGKSSEVVKMIEKAHAEGLVISADQYPYLASGTSIEAALLPRWTMTDSRDAYLKRLSDVSLLPRIKEETRENLRRRGGAETILITESRDSSLLGKTLAQIAAYRGADPVDVALDIARKGGAGVASFNMNPDDLIYFMQQPWVMTGSDGSSGHPRKYGTFPLKYRTFVREKKVLTEAEFIYKSSGQVAETLGIARRGFLRKGYFADIIIFSPETFTAKADFAQPQLLAEGLKYSWINGKMVIAEGKYTGEMPGKALRRKINN
ncbi:MAG: amidohydrolase family protein [Bacteroidia bacterium]|nr:amidohydrolase family protein [Bacteroidia bacterium]